MVTNVDRINIFEGFLEDDNMIYKLDFDRGFLFSSG
jgi:hypothetical protein